MVAVIQKADVARPSSGPGGNTEYRSTTLPVA